MDTGGEDEKNQLREKNVGGKEGRKEVLIHVTTWMNLENIMLRERKPDTKGHILYDSIYMNCLE